MFNVIAILSEFEFSRIGTNKYEVLIAGTQVQFYFFMSFFVYLVLRLFLTEGFLNSLS